jgi:surface polysaccharide O-acyltransferase-like enzyme
MIKSKYYNDLTDRQQFRQSNLELLRIVAMLMIIAHHFSIHGCFEYSNDDICINRLWVQLIQMGGKIGLNIFVLIAGYFGVSKEKIKVKKVIKLWLQLFEYSFVIFWIFILLGIKNFELKELVVHIFPITFSEWWFATVYFVLYLMSPYINRFLNALSKQQYQQFLMLLTVIWVIVPTFTAKALGSNALLWFIYLYSLAGYVRLHRLENDIKGRKYILWAAGFMIFTFLSVIVFDILGTRITFFAINATYFFEMNMLPIVIISILLFIGFLKIDIGYNRIINLISSATFGVYLLHDNYYVRQWLWQTIFKNATYSESNMLIPYSIFVVVLVYGCATGIELLRSELLEKYYMKFVNELCNRMGYLNG